MEPEVYLRHIENEETHWWFKSRRKIICSIIERNLLSGEKKLNILDYGAGSGTNVEMLSTFGDVYVYEKDEKTSKFLIEKFKNNKNIKIVNQLDYKDFFDLIIAADVIEHIEDDNAILKYFSNLLNENGKILLTVPAYNFLYSSKDRILHHHRRYNKKRLKSLVEKYFEIIKLTYYNFFLFAPLALSILFLKLFKINFINSVETKPNRIINEFLFMIFNMEKYLLRIFNFPFGLSLILIARKIR